jgi:hypothetical protein
VVNEEPVQEKDLAMMAGIRAVIVAVALAMVLAEHLR